MHAVGPLHPRIPNHGWKILFSDSCEHGSWRGMECGRGSLQPGTHWALPAAALGPEGGRRPQAAHTPHFALGV